MEVKEIHYTILVILIVIAVILSLYFYIPKTSKLSVINSSNEINTDIIRTKIIKIAEDSESITYRFKWFSADDFTYNAKILNLKFYVGDYQDLREKPSLPSNVPNQFDVPGNVVLTGLYNKNLITKKSAYCNLVNEQGKPIISCIVNVVLESDIPIKYYGNIDGYIDVTFRKEV